MESKGYKQATIRLNDDYIVTVNSMDYTLRKVYISAKTGKPATNVIGYYTCLSNAIKGAGEAIFKDRIEGGDMSLKEAVRAFERSSKEVADMLARCLDDKAK